MKWVDRLSERIAVVVVNRQQKGVDDIPKIEGISQEIDILRELKDEIVKRDAEILRQQIEWDRTFDSIIDNISIIDGNRRISKVNKSFVLDTVGDWTSVLGMKWDDYKDAIGIPPNECVVSVCFDTKLPCESTITIGRKIYSVVANPILDDHGDAIGVVRISRDITNIENQRRTLERRSNIYHAISVMSRTLVDHSDWNDAIKSILDRIGKAIGASRVYIFKNNKTERGICSVVEHVHTCDDRECGNPNISECINYEFLPEWESNMKNGLSVSGSIIDCHMCTLKQRCTCSSDILVCAVPIFVDKKWWGFIGFDYANGNRKWKDEDETLLRIAADILGGNIYHRERYYKSIDGTEK